MFHSLEKNLEIETINFKKRELKKLVKEFKVILKDFTTQKGIISHLKI